MKIKDRAKPKAPPVEPGVYPAVCIGVIDLGEQYSEKFKNYANKVKFIWELAGETIEVDGEQKPRQLSKEFTFSISKKGSLRAFLGSWNGKEYGDEEFGEVDLFDQIGKACQLQVVLNETGEYANVANLMPLPRGMALRRTQNGGSSPVFLSQVLFFLPVSLEKTSIPPCKAVSFSVMLTKYSFTPRERCFG